MGNLIIAPVHALRAAVLALLLALIAACTAEPQRPDEPAATPIAESEEAVDDVEEPAASEPVQKKVALNPSVPLRYTVKKGDTLWSIAAKFLKDPWHWPELWYVNKKVKNPHRIFPGDTLELFFKDGRPLLAQSQDADALKAGQVPAGTARLSPQVRDAGSTREIPAIPIDVIRNFLTGPRLVTLDELDPAPYILDFVEEHLYAGAGTSAYVRGTVPNGPRQFDLLRLGAEYRDPDDDALLGYEALPIGTAQLTVEGDPATVLLTKTLRETATGDRLLPTNTDAFAAQFFPHPPAQPVGGRIISVYDGMSHISQYQVVTLNRGSTHGLEPGHVLHVFQANRVAKDRVQGGKVVLPDTQAGSVMVFKVTPRLSYALVMSATHPIHVLDRVEKPE